MHSTVWDVRGCFVDAILELDHPGLLLLQDLYKVFSHGRLPLLCEEDYLRVQQLLKRTFAANNDVAHQLQHLDDVFHVFLPTNVSLASRGVLFLAPSVPAGDDTNSGMEQMDVDSGLEDFPSNIQTAGNAIVQYLLHIQHLHISSRTPFKSPIPSEKWVSKFT